MILLPLISYRLARDVSVVSSTAYIQKPFGFEAGGGFAINVSKIGTQSILISVCNKSASTNFLKVKGYDCSNFLSICSNQKILTVENSFAYYNDTVPQKGKYTTFFTVCDASISSYHFDAQFWNPNSKLSTTEYPCVYIKPIFLAYCGALLVFWIINWIIYRKGSTVIHKYFSFAFVLAFFSILVQMIYYLHYNKNDKDIGISTASEIFEVIYETIIFTGIVLLSEGYGIIDNDYTIWTVIKTFIEMIVIFVSLRVYVLIQNIWFMLFILVLFTAAFMILFNQMFKGSRDAILKIQAHRIIIEQSGIDFTTTPFMNKFQILTRISWIFTGYLVLRIVVVMLQVFITIDEWIPVLILDILNGSLITLVVIYFKLNEQTAAGYAVLGESNVGRQEITREEVFRYLQQEAQEGRELRAWDGMTELPPPPILVDSPTITMNDQENELDDGELDDVEAPPVAVQPESIEPLEDEPKRNKL